MSVNEISTYKPYVSVIIPTFNSERTIAKCLESIKSQTYENVEIIVVDKFSNDKTVHIAMSYGAKVFKIHTNERCGQMNYGVKKAEGKYIDIAGSDFVLEPTVIEEAVEKCEKECYDAICIHNTSDPTISFWARVRKLERDCYADDELNVAAGFIRRDVFESIGGYDIDLVANEDYDLHNRLVKKAYRIGRIKSKEIHIGEPKSLKEIARKHYYYGKTLVKFLEKNKGKGMKQLSPIRPAFVRHWKDFVYQPTLTLGFVIYQLVKFSSAGLGYLIGKERD
jgi:glycosyltransferase involved in cell wall biosynthesis